MAWGYETNIRGPTGTQGPPGPIGPQGEPGVTLTGGVAQAYIFGSTTTPPPMTGRIRLNNANQTLATVMWVHYVNDDGIDISTYIAQRLNVNDTIYVQDRDNASYWQLYGVTAAFTDSGTYATIPVVWKAGGTAIIANAAIIVARETGTPLVRITVGPTPPSSPILNDVWIDTS